MIPEELGPTTAHLEAQLRRSRELRGRRLRRFALWRALAYAALVVGSLAALGFAYAWFAQDSPLDTSSAIDAVRANLPREFVHHVLEPIDDARAPSSVLRESVVLPGMRRLGLTEPASVLRALGLLNAIAALSALACLVWLGLRLGTRRANAWSLLFAVGTSPWLVALAASPADGPLGFALVALGMLLGVRTSCTPGGGADFAGLTAVLWLACLEGCGLVLLPLWCVACARPGAFRRMRIAVFLLHLWVGLGLAFLAGPDATLTRGLVTRFGDGFVLGGAFACGALVLAAPRLALPMALLAVGAGVVLHAQVFESLGSRASLAGLLVVWLVGALVARRLDRLPFLGRVRVGVLALLVVAASHVDDAWALVRHLAATRHVHAVRARFLREDLQPGEVYLTERGVELPFLIAEDVPHRHWTPGEVEVLEREIERGAVFVVAASTDQDPAFVRWRDAHAPRERARLDPTTFRQVFDPEARDLTLAELSRTSPERLLTLGPRDP